MALSRAEYTVLADGAISSWNRWRRSRSSVDREAFRGAMAALVPHLPGPEVRTVRDMRSALSLLDPDMPVLIESTRSGYGPCAVDVMVMQELDGHGRHGRFQFPTEAGRLISRRNAWESTEDGPPPTLVGEVFAAVILRRWGRVTDRAARS